MGRWARNGRPEKIGDPGGSYTVGTSNTRQSLSLVQPPLYMALRDFWKFNNHKTVYNSPYNFMMSKYNINY